MSDFQQVNNTFFDYILSGQPELEKKALDDTSGYTRLKFRELSWFDRVLPPKPVKNDEFQRSVTSDKLKLVTDMEPTAPAAISVPFNANTFSVYMQAPRYETHLDRIFSGRMSKDIDEFRTWQMDIRQVFSDILMKEMLTHVDSRAASSLDVVLGGSAGTTLAPSSSIHWEDFNAPISRDGIVSMLQIMPSLGDDTGLMAKTALTNIITYLEFAKWGRNEAGGDISQDMMLNGVTSQRLFDIDWVTTIKHSQIPNGEVTLFADPAFLGQNRVLTDITLTVKHEGYNMEFELSTTRGATWANVLGLARAQFDL